MDAKLPNSCGCGFGRRSYGRRYGRRSFGRRFGSSDIPIFQSYTGEPGHQLDSHMTDVPDSLKTNFYTNGSNYGRRRKRLSQNKLNKLFKLISNKKTKKSKTKKSKKTNKSRFGSSDISLFQQYTGMSPIQMENHLTGIPSNLRDNFYTNGQV